MAELTWCYRWSMWKAKGASINFCEMLPVNLHLVWMLQNFMIALRINMYIQCTMQLWLLLLIFFSLFFQQIQWGLVWAGTSLKYFLAGILEWWNRAVVTKILSCWLNKRSRPGIKQLLFLLVLFSLYFPMTVARDHVHSSGKKSPAPSP